MRIREAIVTDAGAIARVHVAAWQSTYRGIMPDALLDQLAVEPRERYWADLLGDPSGGTFLYVADDAAQGIVGFAAGGPERDGNPQYLGELYAIYLLAEFQRRGVGRQLTRAVVSRLCSMRLSTMLVWVLNDNPSRHFYAALGGHEIARREITIGGTAFTEVAYGWDNLDALAASLRADRDSA